MPPRRGIPILLVPRPFAAILRLGARAFKLAYRAMPLHRGYSIDQTETIDLHADVAGVTHIIYNIVESMCFGSTISCVKCLV